MAESLSVSFVGFVCVCVEGGGGGGEGRGRAFIKNFLFLFFFFKIIVFEAQSRFIRSNALHTDSRPGLLKMPIDRAIRDFQCPSDDL